MATVNPILDNTYDDAGERSPLILGGLDYAGVTDEVCGIWEADKPPKIWFVVLGAAISLLMVLGGCVGHLLMDGVGVWGKQQSRLLGLANCQLRFLGWYWTCWNPDFSDSVLVPSKLADKY